MAANRNEQVDKFVKGICRYISHVFETDTIPEFTEEEYAPSESLTILFRRCINLHKRSLRWHNFDYVYKADRITILQTTLTSKLKEAAQMMQHTDFLIKCATHIVSGSYLKQKGFSEAPGIIADAIYEAFVCSQQPIYLTPWFYVQKLKLPIVCIPGNAMRMTPLDRERVDKFVRGICKYISFVYETGTEPVPDEKVYTPSEPLRNYFIRIINHHKNYLRLHTYDFVDKDNRVITLLENYTDSLIKAAESLEHLDFLVKCVTYIIAGTCLEQQGFKEAPEIALVAIYYAFVFSKQYKYLNSWFYVEKPRTPTA